MTPTYHLTHNNNPNITINDALLFQSALIPSVGDKITVNNSRPVIVKSVEIINDTWKHNIKVEIEGEGLDDIREMLTYRID